MQDRNPLPEQTPLPDQTPLPEQTPLPDQSPLISYQNELKRCISENLSLKEEEMAEILDAIRIRTCKAGQVLLRAGEVAAECYLNLKGCVREYYLVDGVEKTTFFYTEGQGFAAYASAGQQSPSPYYLSCVEETVLAVTDIQRERELYRKYPEFESLSRMGTEIQLGKYKEFLASYMISSPEERYLELLRNRPELLHRIPQYQLASYIGVTPESLSRIRKRIMGKNSGENVKTTHNQKRTGVTTFKITS